MTIYDTLHTARLGLLCFALALVSCESAEITSDPGDESDATADTSTPPGVADVDPVTDTVSGDAPTDKPDVAPPPPDVDPLFDVPEDLIPDVAPTDVTVLVDVEDTGGGGGNCPGCFGTPCEDHLDCNSQWCVQGPDGLNCSKLCSGDCPQGYSCQQVSQSTGDPAFLCIYDHVHYCRPCAVSSDCWPPLVETSEARCREVVPGQGSFCETPCNLDADCPANAECVTVEIDGVSLDLCQPLGGECTCSPMATLAQASTACYNANDHGTCEGVRSCTTDGLTDCSGGVPAAEICNEADDDCDDTVDEALVDVGLPCDGDDTDECEDGVWACEDGTLTCLDDPTSGEICNNADDDCDGEIDEDIAGVGEACDGDDADECADGVLTCTGGVLSCNDGESSEVETCNGGDDDCDGKIDEEFAEKNMPCDGPDSDECEEGEWFCEGNSLTCTDTSDDNEEVCDNDDDDCDGKIDETFLLKDTPCDGEDGDFCSDGVWVCDGVALFCNDPPGTFPEYCNNADDDCDGQIDEDYPGKWVACDGDDPDDCDDGQMICGPSGTNLECDDSADDGGELCNELDDDCDGNIDEDFLVMKGEICDGDDEDSCSDGVWDCDGEVLVCNDSPESIPEVCNGADDDCDSDIDEDLEDLACEVTNEHGTCFGTQTCGADGVAVCNAATPLEEICNDLDDDCDGVPDDGWWEKGQPCDGDDADECTDGTTICAGGEYGCTDDDTSVVEVCNGEDDDCDDIVDEGFAVGEACDGDDGDECADGVWSCADDGGLSCDDDEAFTVEECNSVDDNCDGVTDEGCCGALGEVCCDTGVVCQAPFACENDICTCDPMASAGCVEGDAWWLDCQGEPASLKAGCGSCGCVGGECDHVSPPICLPDQEALENQNTDCGLCGTQQQQRARTCSLGCEWPDWGPWTNVGECTSEGVCSPGAPEDDTQSIACGACGQQTQTRARVCGDGCQWEGWTEWENQGSCVEGGLCAPNDTQEETQTVNCDYCGTKQQKRTRSCTNSCGWGDWGSWSDTTGCSNPGVCQPDTQSYEGGSTTCGQCGTQQPERVSTCNSSCQWGAPSGWYNVGSCGSQGPCNPGEGNSETTLVSCTDCGVQQQKRDRTCTNSCHWGGWGGWYNIGSCSGQGECSVNDVDYELQNVSCGNCGTKQQRRDRICNGGCSWGAYGAWYDDGACIGQGDCQAFTQSSNAQTVDCGNCGSQLQVAYRTCSASCSWGGYGAWENVGPCDDQGVCEPNIIDTEYKSNVPCGNCGTKTQFRQRVCNGGCSWGGWGSWQDTNGPTDGCSGEGECVAGTSQSCNPGWWDPACYDYGKTCDGDCGWGGCACTEWCWESGGFDENCF